MAFGLYDLKTGINLATPSMMTWQVSLGTYLKNILIKDELLNFSACTQSDIDKFYPTSESDQLAIESLLQK